MLAKDYWFFSFACNGMNLRDIAELRNKNLKSDSFRYYRRKTNTADSKPKEIEVFLNDISKEILERLKVEGIATDYVFPIFSSNMSATAKQRTIKNFTRRVNQHIKLLAKDIGIDEDISSYWARHSFATAAVNNKISMEVISDALNHSDLRTTQIYISNINKKNKKKLASVTSNILTK